MTRRHQQVRDQFHLIELDKYRLDKELVNQPDYYAEWAEKLADARADLEDAKTQLEFNEAKLSLDIRRNPLKFDLGNSPTEGAIKAVIKVSKRYQEANDKVKKIQHLVGILSGYVTSLDHRKKALEKLVDLQGRDYYATPTIRDTNMKEKVSVEQKRSARTKRPRTNKRGT